MIVVVVVVEEYLWTEVLSIEELDLKEKHPNKLRLKLLKAQLISFVIGIIEKISMEL